MPFVMVNKGRRWIDPAIFAKFVERIPGVVSGALTCDNPDGKLTPKDIEVWVRRPDDYDIGSEKLQVVVFAGLYPERLANKSDRQKMIEDGIKKLLPPNVHGWVWVRFADGSFGEF